MAPQILAK